MAEREMWLALVLQNYSRLLHALPGWTIAGVSLDRAEAAAMAHREMERQQGEGAGVTMAGTTYVPLVIRAESAMPERQPCQVCDDTLEIAPIVRAGSGFMATTPRPCPRCTLG